MLAEIDAPGRAPEVAASPPTPRRCSGCACSTASSSRSSASPATSTTTTTRATATSTACSRRRRGIPITLALLYVELADQIGLDAQRRLLPRPLPGQAAHAAGRGRDRPVHRPVDVARRARRAARAVSAPRRPAGRLRRRRSALFLQAARPREVIARMLRNLKEIHRSARTRRACSRVAERLVILLPDAWEERRDRGLVARRARRALPGDGRSGRLPRARARRARPPRHPQAPRRARPRRRVAAALAPPAPMLRRRFPGALRTGPRAVGRRATALSRASARSSRRDGLELGIG